MTGLRAARPADLPALSALLAETTLPLHYVAGGTDMLVSPRQAPTEGWLVDISRTRGLAEISLGADALRIGAAVTLSDLIASDAVRRHLPVLTRAADLCGSAQIRNRATIGGNVATASPASDLLPVLRCAGARFLLLARSGKIRTVEFEELVVGAGRTALAPGELITRVDVPLKGRLQRFAFVKLGSRHDLTIARINLAMEADFDPMARHFGNVRLVAGAIAPVPLPLPDVAATIAWHDLTPERATAFMGRLADAVDRAIPGRASQGYKRRAIMGAGLDLLESLTGHEELLP